ncbi:MAG TPA: Bpu10I family restriction endonuclease, partial [Terriglobia bacterium]|nr:Bpu10I family restriction endonuclease [Terriglobia bacterium]
MARYHSWIEQMETVSGAPVERIERLIQLLNEYRLYLDVELIFNSDSDFLYRQKGQLKLDNSVIEEFLPWLIH